MSKSERMPEDLRQKVLRLRMDSKSGRFVSEQDQRFLVTAWKRWPEDYKIVSEEAHEQVRPDGPFRKTSGT